MSATDELRRLLDERGVRWSTRTEEVTGIEHVMWASGDHGQWDYNIEFGTTWLSGFGDDLTPQQAIDATLGRGECHMELPDLRGPAYTDVYVCSECGGEVMVGTVMGESDVPKWCPWCGRKVVDE